MLAAEDDRVGVDAEDSGGLGGGKVGFYGGGFGEAGGVGAEPAGFEGLVVEGVGSSRLAAVFEEGPELGDFGGDALGGVGTLDAEETADLVVVEALEAEEGDGEVARREKADGFLERFAGDEVVEGAHRSTPHISESSSRASPMRAFAWRSCRRSWVVEALDLDDQAERLRSFSRRRGRSWAFGRPPDG